MKKALQVMVFALVMILTFAGCGGTKAPAGPNGGVGGIVFTVPEEWTLDSSNSYSDSSRYLKPDSQYELYFYVLTQETLHQYGEEYTDMTMQEYFDQRMKELEEVNGKNGVELQMITVCDTDAAYIKTKIEGGYGFLETSWLMDDMIYFAGLQENVSFDENGEVIESNQETVPISETEVEMYEGVIASIQKGDGSSYQKASLTADSIGQVTYKTPDGFTYDIVEDSYIAMYNDEALITISLNDTPVMSAEDYDEMVKSGKDVPDTFVKMYEEDFQNLASRKIAGQDGYMSYAVSGYDNMYQCYAAFIIEDMEYVISLERKDYIEDGAPKPDAVPLTKEELAMFDKFINTFKKK